ncbi:Uncharacterized protein BM_BM5262 [Brugia malayi]|uniref:Bm5262, isoform b n=1 Tax=Brugia malayi TaxID=6279 RepID=A0A1P6C4T4_BRUMA|nr:Uncharacterized protein BM_BM5262 [Brugia malayi]CDP95977.1 Bm5262, isoform b [Brugia malayi]VIO89042.1 Uncharacterized protein BM_BM5262 [Brugia malayi]
MKVQVLFQAAAVIILVLNVKVSDACAEQLQRCAIITEEYERLIQESKRSAFQNCFTKQICSYELALFENCFERSIRAVRASFNREILRSDNFVDSADRYLSALENCFDITQESIHFPDFKPTLIDEDAIYARTIYSVEFADYLWGLPQLVSTYPYLESSAALVCLIREKSGRVFGNGINRFIDSVDLKLNNVNDSCLLEENEIQCYRRHLSNDRFYQELLIDKDRVVRSCIRSVRLQTQCHSADASRLRACLCSAREEFENRIQASMLQCVRQSHADHLYRERQQPQRQWYEQQNEHFNKPILSTGTIRNDQCLCTCPYNCVNFMDQEKLKRQMQTDPINGLQTESQEQMRMHSQRRGYWNYFDNYVLKLKKRRRW